MVTSILLFVVSGGISPGSMGAETSLIFLSPQSPDTLPLHKGHSVQSHYSHFSCGECFLLLSRDGLAEGGGGGRGEKLGGSSLKKTIKIIRWKRRVTQPQHPDSHTLLLPAKLDGPGHDCLVRALLTAAVSTICHLWATREGRSSGRTGMGLLESKV